MNDFRKDEESEIEGENADEDISDEAMRETMKDIEKLSELIKDVVPVYNFAKPHEKEKIIRIIFSELYVSQDVLQYKVKKGFEAFKDRLVAICDLTGSRNPITRMRILCPSH